MNQVSNADIVLPAMHAEEVIRGRYRIRELLGRGATKDVFRAIDTQTGDAVALARIVGVEPQDLEQELALARRVNDAHVVKVLDLFVEGSCAYLVSELVVGPTLAQRVESEPLPVFEAVALFLQLAQGLRAIHAAHILHRDIKLENVIVSEDGPKVSVSFIDFGIARSAQDELTSAGVLRDVSGSVGYMPREVVRAESLDARSDVYALGVCYFRLLTGKYPLEPRGNVIASLKAIVELERHDLSPLPPLPEPVRNLIARMLDVDRDRRPYTPEIVATLESLLGQDNPLGVLDRTQVNVAVSQIRSQRAGRDSVSIFVAAEIHYEAALDPSCVLTTSGSYAPIVVILRGAKTCIEGRTSEGLLRWSTEIEGEIRSGIATDLDGDGVKEIYVFGPRCFASLDVRGSVRFRKSMPQGWIHPQATAFVLADPLLARVVIDLRVFDSRGEEMKRPLRAYEGDGRKLVSVSDGGGLSFNGYANQAFRGAHRTGAAILTPRRPEDFHVAQLEVSKPSASSEVQLGVYGPGGRRVQGWPIAKASFATGDVRSVSSFVREGSALSAAHAPIACAHGPSGHIVVVPLIGSIDPFPPVLTAFSMPEGRCLWKRAIEARSASGAIFADLTGSGKTELLVGTNDKILRFAPDSGEELGTLPVGGQPIVFGDPFGSGHAHLITVGSEGLVISKVRETIPGLVTWSGQRADLWRSGTLSEAGIPLGPV